MVGIAQGSRSGLSSVKEVVFGTTPVTPAMVDIPFNTHSLNLTKQTFESAQIRADREVQNFRHGNKQNGGSIEVDFRADDHDFLLESAFFSTFATTGTIEMKLGTDPQFNTIEDRSEDITVFRIFTGMSVNTMTMNIAPNAMVTMTCDMLGDDMTTDTSPLDASITDASNNIPFDSFTGVLLEGGSSIAIVTALDFNIDNSMSPAFTIGSDTARCLEFGKARVTGNITVYYEDKVLIDKFINETESSLSVALTDGVTGNTYTFLFARIIYNGADTPVANEQSRTITLPFAALRDSTELTALKVTKS